MGASQQSQAETNVAANVFAWMLNVLSAVTIVFVNKVLMDQNGNYRFTFACTLSAIHFLTAAACMKGALMLKPNEKQTATLPWKDTLYFATVAVISIASLNLSLLVNPVGLYQVAKLLIIPFVCGVEAIWLGRRFNTPTVMCIATVAVGVAVVTVNDLGSGSTHMFGVIIAAVSVVSSGMQQILCGTMQRAHKLQSHQLLAATAPTQGAMLLLMGPWVDKAVSGNWIGAYVMSTGAAAVLFLSCAISVAVNLSQFMCLGRFSAVTFQVLGHTKTILVLLITWLALGEVMSGRKLTGMTIAVAGMIAYSYFVNAGSSNSSSQKRSKPVCDCKSDGDDDGDDDDAMKLGKAKDLKSKYDRSAAAGDTKQQEDAEAGVPLLHSKGSNAV